MANRHRANRSFAFPGQLEELESRRLLATGSGWNDVLTGDALLSENSVPSTGPTPESAYTIRALVQYYNTVYNGASTEPFTIELRPNTTYTLSNSTNTSNVDGGRNNEQNEYGALDIEPSQTTAPLVIQGGPGTVLTCILVGPDSDVPLDRLIHVLNGSLILQNLTLKGGLALDNGTGASGTDALGGGVLVDPVASLSLTSCSIRSNAASGPSANASSSGFNAAGGGIYGSAGSTISITGATSFRQNWAIAGKGGSAGSIGEAGGNAFGAGLAMAAAVAEPSATNQPTSPLTTALSFTAIGVKSATFTGNRLNSVRTPNGTTILTGGTGGAGSGLGGTGGGAYGGGLYLGAGQLNLNGGSLASAVVFTGNAVRGGPGYATSTDRPGGGGVALGPGAVLSPTASSVIQPPTTGGILEFSDNTQTSYDGSVSTTTTGGLDLPPIGTTPGSTSPSASWTLPAALAAANSLASSGMAITLTLPAGDYSLGGATGGLTISNTNQGSVAIQGAGKSVTVIDGDGINGSILTVSSATVQLSNLTISGANASGNGGALNLLDSDVTLSSVAIKNNGSLGNGGGIYQSGGTLLLENSTVSGNTASGSGGGVYSQDSGAIRFVNVIISQNTVNATGAASGGGLYLSGGTLNSSGLTVQQNKITATTASAETIEGAGIFATGSTLYFNGGSSGSTTVSSNFLTGNGTNGAFGAGIALVNGALVVNSPLSLTNNSITQAATGVGAGIAFFSNTTFGSSFTISLSGNSATTGGNDYAFLVTNPNDSNGIAPSGPNGINLFTGGSGSLRSAINYCENTFSLGLANSMAIMLAAGTYSLSASLGQLVSNVNSGASLTILGQNGRATLTAGQQSRDLYVENSGTLVLQNLSITGGKSTSQGGGIYQQSGTLTLIGVTVQGNYAGQSGTASNNFPAQTTYARLLGKTALSGAAGASGYGGGLYLGGGTLNLLSKTTITGNTVQGQNGAPGQNGAQGTTIFYDSWLSTPSFLDGQNGGAGGDGGDALGGGLYQAGGTLNAPDGSTSISGNTAEPGSGGAGGSGGPGAVYKGTTVGSPGTPGAAGTEGASCPNYSNAGGSAVYSASSSSVAQVVSGGLYSTSGSLSGSAGPNGGRVNAASSTLSGLPGVTVQLYAADGRLVATAQTDRNGRYRFQTDFSGMGYIQLIPIPTLGASAEGSGYAGGISSGISPMSLRSGLVQFIAGTAVNRGIGIVLTPIDSRFHNGANTVALHRKADRSLLWRAPIVPASYQGSFAVTRFDVNGDHTPDYLLLKRKWAPRLFIVDGRSGAVTRLAGVVSSGLRAGMVVQQTDLSGPGTQVLILSPKNGRSGRISVVDVQTRRLLWTSKTYVRGGMTVGFVGSAVPGHTRDINIKLSSIKYPGLVKVLDGRTGKVVFARKPPPGRRTARPAGVAAAKASGVRPHLAALHRVNLARTPLALVVKTTDRN